MRRTRVFAIHLTKPSSSEAKVVATLLRAAAPDLEFMLATNKRGVRDPASHFADLPSHNPNVACRALEVGMPIDPQAPSHLATRALWRVERQLRRGKLLALAREYAPQLVYTSQQDFDCQMGEWIAKALGVPHAVHLHYAIGPWLRPRPLRRIRTCDLLFCISEFIAAQARRSGADPRRIVLLHNTLDVPDLPPKAHEAPAEDSPLTIGQVGRMAHGKGFEDTLAAFLKLRRDVPSARLVLVGDGPERARIEAAARSAGVADQVQFTGWQADVRSFLAKMDIFAFPSRDEPFGLALLEACALGLPCVAYRDGAVPEIVVHEETGLLVAPGDVAGLADGLLRLCNDPQARRALGLSARERVRTVFRPDAAAELFSRSLRALAQPTTAAAARNSPPPR